MSAIQWHSGTGWVGDHGNFRSTAVLRRDWVRLTALTNKHYHFTDKHVPQQNPWNDEDDEFMVWVFIFGLMAVLYSLSRYLTSQWRHGSEFVPHRPHQARTPIQLLQASRINTLCLVDRIDTWCPAKPYSQVLSDFHNELSAATGGEVEMVERDSHGVDLEKDAMGRFLESGCAICFEEFSPSALVRLLPCQHLFHTGCLDTWFQRSTLCPLCMHDYASASVMPPTSARPSSSPPADASVNLPFNTREVFTNRVMSVRAYVLNSLMPRNDAT